MYDVAVIDGGVIGYCTARELSRLQLRNIILEKEATWHPAVPRRTAESYTVDTIVNPVH